MRLFFPVSATMDSNHMVVLASGATSINDHLVGGIPTPLKNHGVRQLGWDDEIPN